MVLSVRECSANEMECMVLSVRECVCIYAFVSTRPVCCDRQETLPGADMLRDDKFVH